MTRKSLVSVSSICIGATVAAHAFAPQRQIIDLPLHSTVEAAGSLMALAIAGLALVRREQTRERHYAWLAAAFLIMGLLDLAHACIGINPAFFWSRALPTLVGGVVAACVWLPWPSTDRALRLLPAGAGVLTLPLCVALVAWPDAWPAMFSSAGVYSTAARSINAAGGVAFLAATFFFLGRGGRSPEDAVFGHQTLLFGIAGVLFFWAGMWDAVWWIFHAIRLVAYLMVLSFVVYVYRTHEAGLRERLQADLMAESERAREAAEQSNRMKDEFLATVSHELRTPATAILGWSGMLHSGRAEGESIPAAVEQIYRSAQAQARLIEDLLELARLSTGKFALYEQAVDLTNTVGSIVAAMRAGAADKGVRLDLAPAPRVGVRGDEARLRQVFANIVGNAVKFTPPGGRVDVRIEQQDGQVEVTVADTGRGIAPQFLPHVFERFRQADGSATREFGGLGIGLSIARELVEAHRGSIVVRSEGVGRGATFIVQLPAVPVQSPSTGEGEYASHGATW